MKIILKNFKNEYIKTLSLGALESHEEICSKISSLKENLEVNIFAINEIINSFQLANLKLNIEKLNVYAFRIFSNKRETILTGKSLQIESIYENEKDLKNRFSSITSNKKEDIIHKGTVRSGNRIFSNGDLFILGDVNPGGIIQAKKNIIVWGKLLGIAFAGENGDKNATISSLHLNPLQLRINGFVAIGPKEKPKDYYPEVAFLENQSIIIKPLILNTSTLINQMK